VELLKVHQRRREKQRADLHVNFYQTKAGKAESQQWAGDKLLPEIGQVMVHRDHFLSQ
jgi:hypothetical protein